MLGYLVFWLQVGVGIVGTFLAVFRIGAASSPISFFCSGLSEPPVDLVARHVSEPFSLGALTYSCDVHITDAEFFYLADFPAGRITPADVQLAVWYLSKKNKFATITVTISPADADACDVHFDLSGCWTFKRLKLEGMLVGKDAYRQFYLLEPGQPFDHAKHYRALAQIRQEFRKAGYLQGAVVERLEREQKTKAVIVHLLLERGERFAINRVQVMLDGVVQNNPKAYERLRRKITHFLNNRLAGKRYSKQVLNQAGSKLRRYLVEAQFLRFSLMLQERIDYAAKQVDLLFRVTLHEKKWFEFAGNEAISRAQLLDELMELGQSVWLLPPPILAQELQQYYLGRGFLSATVASREDGGRCTFQISEGDRATITAVELRGAHSFAQSELVRACFRRVLRTRLFDIDVIREAIESLVAFYLEHGFSDVCVARHDLEPSDGRKGGSALVVTIQEGVQRMVRAIDVTDMPDIARELRKACAPSLPQPFNPRDVAQQRQWLMQYFQRRGFMTVNVEHELIEHDGAVSIVWHVRHEPEPARFGKVVFVGASSFPPDIILHELPFRANDAWDKRLIDEGTARLRALDVFETVCVAPWYGQRSLQQRPILVRAVEDDPFELRMRLGFAQVSKNLTFRKGGTVRLGGAFFWRNPSNRGDFLRLDADYTFFNRHFAAQYARPFFCGAPLGVHIKGYATEYTQPLFIGSNEPLYEAVQHGVLGGVSYRFAHGVATLNIGYERMKTQCIAPDLAAAIDLSPALVNRSFPYIFLEPTLLVDLTDDRLNPTRGTLTVASLKAMIPHDSLSGFVRVLFEQAIFFPLTRYAVFAGRARVGHLFNRVFQEIMPPERFYLGGAHSLRGYNIDAAPPVSPVKCDDGDLIVVPQGGKTMINLNAELRINAWQPFTAALFQDLGVLLADDMRDFEERLLPVTGFGLRYNTPVGPLRFDVGFKWRRQSEKESSFAWFLTLGQAY